MKEKRCYSPWEPWEATLCCDGCGQNVFKLIPNCKKHERSRRRFVKLCYDRESLEESTRLVCDLEMLAERILYLEGYAQKVIGRVLEKIDEKKLAASLRHPKSVIRSALQLARQHNSLAVSAIDARECLSKIAHDQAVVQMEQIKPKVSRPKKKATKKKAAKKKATKKAKR